MKRPAVQQAFFSDRIASLSAVIMPYTESFRVKQLHAIMPVLHLVVMGLLVFLAYYPALTVPFTFDDIPNIVLNSTVQPDTFRDLYNALFSGVSGSRPLAMLSFAVNFLAGGLDVFGYHVFNLIVHFANSVILYHCIVTLYSIPNTRLLGALDAYEVRKLALWAALLWALSPVQHQAVTYIVQRMTSMATLFYLLGILSFLKFHASQLSLKWACGLVVSCFVAGMACKEIVITLPLGLVLIERILIHPGRRLNETWIAAAVVIVLIISTAYVHYRIPHLLEKFPNRDYSPYERLLTESRILWHYLSLLLLPVPGRLHLEYAFEVSRSLVSPVTTIFGILAIPGVLASGWLLRNRVPLLSFSIFFYFLASAVEASFLNLGLAYLHRLYLPSLFIFPGLLSCIPVHSNKYLTPLLILIIALFAFGTQQRNADWRNSASLWEVDYEGNANPGLAIVNGGVALQELGRFDDVIKLLNPVVNNLSGADRSACLFTLALAHYHKSEFNTALTYFEAIDYDYEHYAQVLFYKGLSFLSLNSSVDVEKLVEDLRQDHPEKPYSIIISAERLRRAGQHVMAVEILEDMNSVTKLTNVDELNLVRAYLANVFLDMKQYARAYALYLEMVTLDPNAFFAWQQIYAMQVSAGDLEHANVIKAMLESKGVVLSDSTR